MAKVIIFGCGRGADVAARYLAADSSHQVSGFTVGPKFIASAEFRGLPLVDFSTLEDKFHPEEYSLFIPLGFQGMNSLRAEKYLEGKRRGYSFISYVSSKVATHDELDIGENCFILENSSINFDVRIGNNVVIWSGCQLGDQSAIGDHVWISSHATLSGEVAIGEYSFLGVNCTISNGVKVAPRSYIGAASFIAKDTQEKGVYVVEGTKRFQIDSDKFLAFVDAAQKGVR